MLHASLHSGEAGGELAGPSSGDMWELVPRAGMEPRPSESGAWSLSHWTTREVPGPRFFSSLCFQ